MAEIRVTCEDVKQIFCPRCHDIDSELWQQVRRWDSRTHDVVRAARELVNERDSEKRQAVLNKLEGALKALDEA